ncbi:hypothetical protein CMUS01_13935 [Colletotrichum musicola]|uniref:Uncharacterized protein n=1 Tax=Colletotrichum musicola TaxID=2175873 RepID=A0A8H6MU10_9PEZI|nr:hypothetical protein CMUS01_13935 [Colletotrichum musicola]
MGRPRTITELPAWYHRVRKLVEYWDCDVQSHHFDEDISDLECDVEWDDRDCDCETKECAHDCKCEEKDCEHACKCEELPVEVCENDECNCTAVGCWHDEEIIRDDESERSYNGPEKERYYELKEIRCQRKRDRRDTARGEASTVRRAIAHDRKKEDEVRAAYEALKKAKIEGETLHMDSLAHKRFHLHAAKHTEWLGYDPPSRSIDFVPLRVTDVEGLERPAEMVNDKRLVQGQIYLDPDAGGDVGPFRMPARLRRKKYVLPAYCDEDGSKKKVTVQFVSNDHLILRISRDVVTSTWGWNRHRPAPETTPEVFEFMGISDGEKERSFRESLEKRLGTIRSCNGPVEPVEPVVPKSRRRRQRQKRN